MAALLRPASGDFDAPGRTEFVTRALAWVSPLLARLNDAGVEVEAKPLPAAETHAIALRRPGLGPRAALILDVDERGIEAALELPASAPEVESFRSQLHRAASAERIFQALAHLPEPFAIALLGEDPSPIAALDVVALEMLIGRAIEEGKRLRIGWRIAREQALTIPAGDPPLDEQLEGALAALAVPFTLLLERNERPTKPLFRRALPTMRKKKRIEIVVGARVRVLAGPFEGKEAIIAELDGRGSARIRLGLLATRVFLRELDAVAETVIPNAPKRPKRASRPALGSSHRRR
ncbi:MAG: KOW motif-containing protein [Polyangiales bacterium]